MRLFSGRIPLCSQEIVSTLLKHGDIEAASPAEVQLDVEAVLKEYLRLDREISEHAKDIMDTRGLPREQYSRVKRLAAEEKGFGLGDETVGWITNQLIEAFMHSPHVEEVFADDGTLRVHMRAVLEHHMRAEEELEAEVRKRLTNLQEGTSAWEIEYERAKAAMKRAKGLE